jgi:nucleotide-binding universal stress UspA family protein
MGIDTVTLAVGPEEEGRTRELTEAMMDVATAADATVVLLHVFSQTAYEEGVEQAGYDPEDPPPAHTLASRLESVDRIAMELEAAGVEYRVRGEIGDVTDSIVHAVEETDSDLLYIGGRRRSPTGKAVFGSTVHRLMMNAPCPVTFVREGLGADLDD